MDPVGARRLVSQLPPKLLNFFIKYPPRDPLIKTIYSSDDKAISIARKLHDFQPVPPSLFQPLSSTHITAAGTERPIVYLPFRNPFKAHKDLRSGNFHGPVYSLRRQADLIKLAIRYGVVDLLPPSEKMQKMLWGKKKPMSGTLRSKGSYEERNRAVYVENKQAKLEEALRIVQLRNTWRELRKTREKKPKRPFDSIERQFRPSVARNSKMWNPQSLKEDRYEIVKDGLRAVQFGLISTPEIKLPHLDTLLC